jgi:diaminopimelate epimerase
VSGKQGDISFETQAGVISARFFGELVQVQMSEPHSLHLNETVEAAGEKLTVHSMNTGVPHAVVFVDDLETVDVRKFGAGLRYHPHFAPKGTNANFVKQLGPQAIAIRTYERGVEDETLACGTGMVACALIFHELTGTAAPVQVRVRGGDTLEIGFRHEGARYCGVTLTGPADFAFEGQVAI